MNARRNPRGEVAVRHAAAARSRLSASGDDSRAYLYFAATDDIDVGAIALLSRAELARLPRPARAARRAQHLAGRALLRTALEDVTGLPAAEHNLRTTAQGKPECVAGPGVSVSHSGHWVACALATGRGIGVDMQQSYPERRTEEIARQFFSRAESDWLAARPRESFYMLWVLKEAYLKALGLGLAGGLNALQCRVEPPVVEVIAARSARELVSLRLYALEDGFVALATAEGPLGEVAIKRWNPSGAPRWLPGRLRLLAATDR